MTIELSLRRRAARARWFAIAWLATATIILVSTYFSLPVVAGNTLESINRIEGNAAGVAGNSTAADNTKQEKTTDQKSFFTLHMFAVITLVLAVSAVSFACYLLGKSAFVELETAGRLSGIADALCIAGDNLEQLERAAALLVPKAQYLSTSKLISADDLKDFAEVLKKIR